MLKVLSTIALMSSLSLYAVADPVEEYIGRVSDIYIGKTEDIKIGIIEEIGKELDCAKYDDTQWPLYFGNNESYTDQWFEILNLVRRTQEPIRIGYTPSADSSCAIEYLALLRGDGDDNIDPVGDSLTRSGMYGNIALVYTNNLTMDNFTASTHDRSDIAPSAFDGYTFDGQIDERLGSQINRGIWVAYKDPKKRSAEYWLQVKFEDLVTVSGFRVMVNEKSVSLGRSPRVVTVEYSVDGEYFFEQGTYPMAKMDDQVVGMSGKVELQYFRLKVDHNYGDSYIEIDELEIYAD